MLTALKRIAGKTLVIGAGAFVFLVLFAASRDGSSLAFDMRPIVGAADAFVHGRPIYFHPSEWAHTFIYVYPPLFAELSSPLVLLPATAAAWVAALCSLAAVLAALWIVGVRDARVLALASVSTPVVLGSQVANPSALVCLLVALTLVRGSSMTLGVAIAIKLMAWPLTFWFAFVHGMKRAIAAVSVAVALVLFSWALVGFQGLTFYRQILRADVDGQQGLTYGIATSGIPYGTVVAAMATIAALALCWSRARADDEAGAFAFGVAAALTAAPIVWGYYFTLVLLALALRRPRLSPAWFLPLLLWVAPGNGLPVTAFDKALGWALIGGMLIWLGSGAPHWSPLRRRGVADPLLGDTGSAGARARPVPDG